MKTFISGKKLEENEEKNGKSENSQHANNLNKKKVQYSNINLFQLRLNFLGEIHEGFRESRIRIRLEEVFSIIQSFRESRLQWELSQ